jgi:hypothetical protein
MMQYCPSTCNLCGKIKERRMRTTTTPKPVVVTLEPNRECADVRQDCSKLQRVGWCENKPIAMGRICAKTCKLCKKKCKDVRRDCVMLSKYGWCDHKKDTMYQFCPRTCKFCTPTSVKATIPPTTIPPTTLPAVTKPALCVDRLRHCKHLKAANWCVYKKEKMMQGCQLTCKFCGQGNIKPTLALQTKPVPRPTAPRAGCRDTRSDCRKLSKIGMCRLRRDGMKKICPVSCGFCAGPTASPVIPNRTKPKTTEVCNDMYGKTRCEYYKYLGWCEKHANNMRTYCKDTCVCQAKQTKTGPGQPTDCKSSENGCCWDNKTIRESRLGDGNCPKCEDDPRFRVLCDRFGEDCDGDGGLGESLRKYCPKRCDLCSPRY